MAGIEVIEDGSEEKIEQYTIVKLLSEEIFTKIYQVKCANRDFVLTLLNQPYCREYTVFRKFLSANQTCSSVANRKYITNVREVKKLGNLVFIISEWIEGKPLTRLFSEKTITSTEQKIKIARQLCEGLRHLHNAGIVHAGLYPGNITITPDNSVKLAEYCATYQHILNKVDDTVSIERLPYISPEQFSGQPEKTSDIFSLGLILEELRTGKRVIAGSTFKKINEQISAGNFDMHPKLLKAVHPDTDQRYQKVEELILLLDEIFEDQKSYPPKKDFDKKKKKPEKKKDYLFIVSKFFPLLRKTLPLLIVLAVLVTAWSVIGKDTPPDSSFVTVKSGDYTVPPHRKIYLNFLGEPSIHISKTFYIQKGEVTVGDFKKYVNSLDDKKRDGLLFLWEKEINGTPLPNSRPVAYISRKEAADYAEWLSDKTGRTMRLPTPKEWAAAVILYGEANPNLGENGNNKPIENSRFEPDHLLGNLREWSSERCSNDSYYLLGEDFITQKKDIGKFFCEKKDKKMGNIGFRLIALKK